MDITNFISSQVQIGLDIATSFSILGAGYVIFLSRNKERKQLQNQHELLQRHYVIDNLKVFLNNFYIKKLEWNAFKYDFMFEVNSLVDSGTLDKTMDGGNLTNGQKLSRDYDLKKNYFLRNLLVDLNYQNDIFFPIFTKNISNIILERSYRCEELVEKAVSKDKVRKEFQNELYKKAGLTRETQSEESKKIAIEVSRAVRDKFGSESLDEEVAVFIDELLKSMAMMLENDVN